MPVERIPRYKLLLQELLGSTPPEHVDFFGSGREQDQGDYESDESSTNGSPTTSSTRSKKFRRLWITLTLQTISLGSTFKTTQPEETVPIELCLVASLKNETWFRLQFPSDLKLCTQTTYVFESLSLAERDEWVRALKHCISGGDELALRRRSLKTVTLAPIFMLDKISNVCTICTQTFIVYRPRHHCR
ncbi:hypothetical protein PsorP6_009136 [Peronosclerospora sorghi]|uniref:Uncharacterized protein n=1 Tax=Peronosclerospora sorghi TaxID=230839 RepID=A0ACC0W1N3_9STRA|nr:hypothetical protein PsorP6_009136 [Peronosclerospora sorghi]